MVLPHKLSRAGSYRPALSGLLTTFVWFSSTRFAGIGTSSWSSPFILLSRKYTHVVHSFDSSISAEAMCKFGNLWSKSSDSCVYGIQYAFQCWNFAFDIYHRSLFTTHITSASTRTSIFVALGFHIDRFNWAKLWFYLNTCIVWCWIVSFGPKRILGSYSFDFHECISDWTSTFSITRFAGIGTCSRSSTLALTARTHTSRAFFWRQYFFRWDISISDLSIAAFASMGYKMCFSNAECIWSNKHFLHQGSCELSTCCIDWLLCFISRQPICSSFHLCVIFIPTISILLFYVAKDIRPSECIRLVRAPDLY